MSPDVLAAVFAASAVLVGGRREVRVPVGEASTARRGMGPLMTGIAVSVLFLTGAAVVGRVLVGVALVVGVLGLSWLADRHRHQLRATRRAEEVAELCEALAADLSAGLPPTAALSRSVADRPDLAALDATVRVGGHLPSAFRRLAARPGSTDLELVAAAWQVSETSGASLADALRRAARGIQERRRTQRIAEAELSAARATSRLMAALPVLLGVAGAGLGADPLGFLLGTLSGQLCLVAGVLLSVLGLLWLERIAGTTT